MKLQAHLHPIRFAAFILFMALVVLSLTLVGCQKSDPKPMAAVGFSTAPFHNELKQAALAFASPTQPSSNATIERIRVGIFSDPETGIIRVLNDIERTHAKFREDPRQHDCLRAESPESQPELNLLYDYQPKLRLTCKGVDPESQTRTFFGYHATTSHTIHSGKTKSAGRREHLTLVIRETVPDIQISLFQIQKWGANRYSYLTMKFFPGKPNLTFAWASNEKTESSHATSFAWNSNSSRGLLLTSSLTNQSSCLDLASLKPLPIGECESTGLSKFSINLVATSDLDLPSIQAKLTAALQYH